MFYPPKLTQARELEFASRALPSIEINGSFYALQRPESYAAWYASTESALDRWAARIRAWREGSEPIDAQRIAGRSSEAASRDVYCYFDKDIKVKAPFDARRLIDKLAACRT